MASVEALNPSEIIASTNAALQHPVPSAGDLKRSSQAASIASSRHSLAQQLERSAEELSSGGSDIAEEIRKMNEEQKEQDRRLSRHNSVQSNHFDDYPSAKGVALNRGGSTHSRSGSHGKNIVEVNNAARWGGYSPGGFVSSPVGSVRSLRNSWAQPAVARRTSIGERSRLTQMVEPTQEGRPLDSPLAPSASVLHSSPPSRQTSQSSFGRRHEELANQIANAFASAPTSPEKPEETSLNVQPLLSEVLPPGPGPDRPQSTDTIQEAQFAFRDFDGVHFAPETDELIEFDRAGNEIRRVSARSTSGGISLEAATMLRASRNMRASYSPQPEDGMVFYPAPVPRMLNLPKRLSQLPAGDVRSRRRTQVLSQYGPSVRQSAPWLSDSQTSLESSGHGHGSASTATSDDNPRAMLNERMSVANFNNLPPQLRASVFFEHQSIVQDVEIKSESAVATLDSILAASATAPVNAFTDHPFAGDVRRSVYAPEVTAANRRSAAFNTNDPRLSKRRSSASMVKLMGRSSSANDLGDVLAKRASRSATTLLVPSTSDHSLQTRKSHLTLGNEMDEPMLEEDEEDDENAIHAEGGSIEQASSKGRATATAPEPSLNENEQIEADFEEYEADEYDPAETEFGFVQPSTLLAELQVRKAQQKSRNRTAATAFPNGMHSTLLQLDAVEEIRSKNRKNHRIALAWEDPSAQGRQDADADEDVPLGMLYAGQKGREPASGETREWNRPLGLMEKRQLEDGEPLSSRRNRLIGLPPPHHAAPRAHVRPGMTPLPPAEELKAEENGASDDDDAPEGETLGERTRRLRRKSILDSALTDVAPKSGERPNSTFTDDVLSQFGGLDVKDQDEKAAGPVTEDVILPEEETLGQRKARLLREGQSTAVPSMSRPASLANLLTAHPTGLRPAGAKHYPRQGSLLDNNQQAQERQRQQLLMSNARTTSYGAVPTFGEPYAQSVHASNGLLGQQGIGSRSPSGGFAGGRYNNGAGGVGGPQVLHTPQLRQSPSISMLGSGGFGSSYMGSPALGPEHAGMFMPNLMGYNAMNFGMTANQGSIPSLPYQQQGQGVPSVYGFPSSMALPYVSTPNLFMQPTATYGAAAMGMAGADPSLDPRQRANIDRWRMDIGRGHV